MKTTSLLIRRLLSLLVVPAALILPLAAASAAFAQEGGEGGDEEDFYRQSDPEEPVAGTAAAPAPKIYSVHLGLRLFQNLDETSDLEGGNIVPAISLQWLWSALDQEYWLGLEVGVDIGVIYNHTYDGRGFTPAEFEQIKDDFENGIEDVTTQPLNATASDVVTLYGGPTVRVDFMGPSPIDVGAVLNISIANSQIDSEWNCQTCTQPLPALDRGTGSADVAHGLLRLGGYISYQFEWFNIGADVGWVMFLGGDLPSTMGLDFGIALGVHF